MQIIEENRMGILTALCDDGDHRVFEVKKDETNALIYDPGLMHIATCRSGISKVDGNRGKLYYRNESIEDIIKDSDYLDVVLKLMVGKFDDDRIKNFKSGILNYFILYPEMESVLTRLSTDIHPMNYLSIGINVASQLESKYLEKTGSGFEKYSFILAQLFVVASYYYTRIVNLKWDHENNSESISSRFISTTHKDINDTVHKELSDVLNKMLILHAEHGQNCSTMTVRAIASAGGDLYAAITGGIAAFKGGLHGGASQNVGEMYQELITRKYDVNKYVDKKIKNRERLMGFGHRVYKTWDPRAKIMFKLIEGDDYDFSAVEKYRELAIQLVSRVSTDEFFTQRHIYPNPDLLNNIFYKMLGVPSNMNTVMLSLSRISGWMAHYVEQVTDKLPIMRPRQIAR